MSTKLLTLCIIHVDGKVLLGMKKRGFGTGKWNGFGGKVELAETLEAAAMREVYEECGAQVHLTPENKMGVLTFTFQSDADEHEVHIYKVTSYKGEVVETEEMQPAWFVDSKIPYSEMWTDDIFWMPLLLQDKKFSGTFSFDLQNHITEQYLKEEGGVEPL